MLNFSQNMTLKIESEFLHSGNLPYFAHKCALLNLPSYDTTLGFVVEFKRDFKRIKRGPGLALNTRECQSNTTMRKLSKIKLFIFTENRFCRQSKQEFKEFLKNIFSGSNSLQSNKAESLISVSNKQMFSSSTFVLTLSFFYSSLLRFISLGNERINFLSRLYKLFLIERILC